MTELAAEEYPAFPMNRSCPFHSPEQYDQLRAEAPITKVSLPTGQTPWLITRHDYTRKLLADPRVTANRIHPGFPSVVDLPQEVRERLAGNQVLISMDPPVHTFHRRQVIPEFTVKRVQTMRPRIQQIVDDCIAEILAGPKPVDLVSTLALPVPSLVICELLGVPYADHDFFQANTKVAISRTATPEQRSTSAVELTDYLDALVTAKEREPGDDLLGRLILKYRATEDLPADEAHRLTVGMARILLVAGHETTANMISLGVTMLLEKPDQLAELKADPTLTPAAVEEMLRHFSIADGVTARVVLEDMEIGGVTLRAGEGVIALNGAANHDGEVFANPGEFDIHRGARHHVAFGYGVHQCIGQNLARVELEIVFNTLFARIPDLRLTVPMAELPFKDDAFVYGLYELPVTW